MLFFSRIHYSYCSAFFIVFFILTHSLKDWIYSDFRFGYIWVSHFADTSVWYKQIGSVLPIMCESLKRLLDSHFGSVFDYPVFVFRCLLVAYGNNNNTSILWRVIPVISLVVLINVIINIIRKSKNGYNNILLIILTVSLPSWLLYYPILDIHHAWWAVIPLVGVVIYFLDDFAVKLIPVNIKMKNLIFIILLLMVFVYDVSSRIIVGTDSLKLL